MVRLGEGSNQVCAYPLMCAEPRKGPDKTVHKAPAAEDGIIQQKVYRLERGGIGAKRSVQQLLLHSIYPNTNRLDLKLLPPQPPFPTNTHMIFLRAYIPGLSNSIDRNGNGY